MDQRRLVGIDLGIKTAHSAVVTDAMGTVLARRFGAAALAEVDLDRAPGRAAHRYC
ncbi:MAG: hypothetical protein M3O70_22885 [Actinomycetota bacterium]|nr:hypothetical protein [Actinomycetota bacterium]